MNKIVVALTALSLDMTALADVVRLHVTTHVQDGVHFPELGQCFLSAAEPRAVVGEDVLLDLHLMGDKMTGSWEKQTKIDDKDVTYRLSASQGLKTGAPLKIKAQILINGVLENAGPLDLAGDDQWGFPVNFLEATATDGHAACQTANITVVQEQVPEMGISIAKDGR